MDRRTFLSATASAGVLLATSGCLQEEIEAAEQEPAPLANRSHEEIDLPVEQRYEVAAAGIERAADAGIEPPDDLGRYLEEQDVRVETLEEAESEGDTILELEYVVEERIERGFLEQLGVVAGGYAELVAAGHESELLEASLIDAEGQKFGTYDVERTWAEEYDAGVLSAREYAAEVLSTAQSETE